MKFKKGNFREYSANALFALIIFTLFLLLFDNKLTVPLWLQPVGRMHTMILHFPLVLLLLSMGIEFFRFKPAYRAQPFYQDFSSNLLLAGVISSGITVIMGLFLAKEGGYGDSALAWHKWAGVSVFFVSSIIYACRNSAWYGAPAAKTGAVLAIFSLLYAGHLGAAITHGENFIFKPVLAARSAVPLDEALLFDDVIKPILENKCVTCHNEKKLKGKLILTDSISIMKGGKTGKLFPAGKAETSLLLHRIQLSPEDQKHMPPSGNTQLTPAETEVLQRWIKSGPRFSTRVSSLPARDSLRTLAMTLLEADETREEVFDFSAADEQTIKKLNTNYRVVSQLAKESPALMVDIYGRDAYTSQTLDELKDLKVQIVSLNLNRMPVKDADLVMVASFKNLRKLNLNFTGITGKGLEALTSLKHLESLSLSGTSVDYLSMKQYLPFFESLNTMALWNTGLSANEIRQLQTVHGNIQFLAGFKDDGSHPIKLNPPRIRNKPVIFTDSLLLQLYHPVKGVEIRFTTDGSEPDSLNSILFSGQTVIKESTSLKVRAFKSGWLSSDVAILNVYRNSYMPDLVILNTPLSRVHPANGAQTFFDRQLGTFNANSPAWANNWAGFINNDMELLLEYQAPKTVKSVSLNTLIETETFIFPPSSLEVWGGLAKNKMELLGMSKPDMPRTYSKPFIRLYDCKFQPRHILYLKIIAKPVRKIPAWHNKKNTPALLLVDEIFVN